ncbi:MAG: stage II sporulation protein M [Candidatus Nezhaarchaeota archaeon]|nr:stage II sporulation protein M [Candidatus Nezhaarchaeota archaeon]
MIKVQRVEELSSNDDLSLFLAVSLFFFTSSSMVGCYIGLVNPTFSQALTELLGRGLGPMFGLSAPWLLGFILLNNSLKCLAAILLGPIFGLFPLLLGTVNGFILGILLVLTVEVHEPLFFLAAVTPHGMFEIPAVLLSVAIGLKEGWMLIKKIGGEGVNLKMEIKRGVRLYFKAILPLITFAAFIEVSLTPLILTNLKK